MNERKNSSPIIDVLTVSTDGEHESQHRPALVFLSGDNIGAPIPLERDDVIIGRALEADVRINDALASRLHARIFISRVMTARVSRTIID